MGKLLFKIFTKTQKIFLEEKNYITVQRIQDDEIIISHEDVIKVMKALKTTSRQHQEQLHQN